VETADAAWKWMQDNFDKLAPMIPEQHAAASLGMFQQICTKDRRDEIEAFFKPRAEKIAAAPANLKKVLESLDLCASLVAAQRPSADSFFQARGGAGPRTAAP
jgi:alanyl aminopeptidase